MITSVILRALNYAKFSNKDLEEATRGALRGLQSDLEEAEYVCSSDVDELEENLEVALKDVDEAEDEAEDEEDSDETEDEEI